MKPGSPIPPRRAEKLLLWFLRDELAEEVLGDLEEKFHVVADSRSVFRARLNYWYQVINYVRPFAIKHLNPNPIIHTAMYQHYFKISWRNLMRDKVYSFLNVSGLAVGMACSILILLWVRHESSYDQFHSHVQDIYRLTAVAGNDEFKAAVTPAGMAAGLREEMPEIHSTVRLGRFDLRKALFEVDEQPYIEDDIFYADSNFLAFFNFSLLQGDPETVLKNPNGMLLTESTARKYFGSKDPMGQTIKMDDRYLCTVTGILADIPQNSHLQFSLVLPMEVLARTHDDLMNETWDNFGFYTYIRFREGAMETKADLEDAIARIDTIYQSHSDSEIVFDLQAMADIHLRSEQQFDVPGHGNVQYVRIFFLVAIFILAVACINFMNLATARSARRGKEVGIRKVVGANRKQLVLQFLSESLMVAFLSLAIAMLMVHAFLPVFNDLAGKQLDLELADTKLWLGLIGIVIGTGLLSGSYPALLLSGFQPMNVLKGKLNLKGGNRLFRNGLVITQFVISLVLLVGTVVVFTQLDFIRNKNLGFDQSNLVYFPISGELHDNQSGLEAALAQNPLTQDFSIVSELPTHLTSATLDIEWEGKNPDLQVVISNMHVDERFFNLFQVELMSGRGFSRDRPTDQGSFVLNETAIGLMGITPEEAVGKQIMYNGYEGAIIGVVKDFNFKPLQYAIEPLILQWNHFRGFAVVRTPANKTELAIRELEEIHGRLNASFPLDYHFFDQDLDNLYQGERQMGKIFNLFAALAMFISCLGLYGLSAYMAERRTKEIGIRKVLGASVAGLVGLLSRDFVRLLLVAFVVGIPFSWYLMHEWLQNFAYRIELSWWMFAGVGLVLGAIALLTISHQVLKAASVNPVESLRSE